MRAAVSKCRGLRLLRQEPWECLGSFILSSTKQITQIQQIIRLLCQRFGVPVVVPPDQEPAWAFPEAARLAACTEAELRDCKMGFRAPNLLRAARMVAAGEVDLEALRHRPEQEARRELIRLPGVGEKIADCVLLFGLGCASAFPVDVWVARALRRLYFPRTHPTARELRAYAARYFGGHAGYAQQYLFHYIRLTAGKTP
jgi:N-glycosylase/DNA lyase